MDEPLSNLDAKLGHCVRQDICRVQRRLGMTVIYVTHDRTEAMSMADTVVLMREGRIEQAASQAEIYANPTIDGRAAQGLCTRRTANLPCLCAGFCRNSLE